ncbi:hypothetical protein V5F77_05060 [Xanthobacter sp. DSM 24535]|uniref:hypothetical protein n=1 Tax=Roseixanthobacter psychrophilus TaxID=3119917 RepID=UPI0037293162
MTITYPRAFPSGSWFTEVEFTLSESSSFNVLQNGAVQTTEYGESIWLAKYTTKPLYEATMRHTWQSWWLSLRGGKTFLGYDPEKVYPAFYGAAVLGLTKAGGGAFTGAAVLNSYTATTVGLLGLPASYKATSGDMLSFPWNGVKALHMVMEDSTANGSGAVTLSVWPPVRSSPAPGASAVVDMVRPSCVMKIRPGSTSAVASKSSPPATFEAAQTLI